MQCEASDDFNARHSFIFAVSRAVDAHHHHAAGFIPTTTNTFIAAYLLLAPHAATFKEKPLQASRRRQLSLPIEKYFQKQPLGRRRASFFSILLVEASDFFSLRRSTAYFAATFDFIFEELTHSCAIDKLLACIPFVANIRKLLFTSISTTAVKIRIYPVYASDIITINIALR